MSESNTTPPKNVDPAIIQGINRFLIKVKEIVDENHKKNGFVFQADTFEPDYGRKYCRIWSCRFNGGKSSYAFIALVDHHSKEMGMVTAGEIFKPATYRAPAKHARGTIFQEDFNKCISAYGIAYLR